MATQGLNGTYATGNLLAETNSTLPNDLLSVWDTARIQAHDKSASRCVCWTVAGEDALHNKGIILYHHTLSDHLCQSTESILTPVPRYGRALSRARGIEGQGSWGDVTYEATPAS